MKKILLTIFSIVSVFMLSGCVDTNITVDIEKNGDTIVSSDILVKDAFFEKLSKSEMDKLKKEYDVIEKITTPGKSGYRVTDKMGNLKNINENNLAKLKGADEFKDIIDLKVDKKLLYNTYDINFKIKDYMLENKKSASESESNKTILSAIRNSSNVNFNLKLPVELIESNATSTRESEGKHVYSWNYTLDNMDNIHVKANIYNVKNIILITMLVITLMAVVIILILRMRKNRNEIKQD